MTTLYISPTRTGANADIAPRMRASSLSAAACYHFMNQFQRALASTGNGAPDESDGTVRAVRNLNGESPLTSRPRHVVFRFYAAADEVKLVADFAGWEAQPIDLRQVASGHWQITVELPPGRYAYRFLVDGHWQDDPQSVEHEINSFGTINAVVKVS